VSGRESLAEAFAPAPTPARGARLEGLLAPKRGRGDQAPKQSATEAPSTEAPSELTTETEEPVAAPKTIKPRTVKKPFAAAPAKKASETVPGALRNVGVYLTPQLLADVRDAAYRAKTTYADLLIDAFEALTDEQIAREFAPETTLTSSGMPRRAPRRRGEGGIQIQLRLDDMQIAWLDGKVKAYDAPSRSALVSTVFRLHVHQEPSPGAGE
jgi:hypothetical protein